MDYFAWLFNNDHLTVPNADRLWGPLMVCEWKKAIAPAISNPVRDLPNLLRFIREREKKFSGRAPC
jgi:hypothetical protein